MTAAGEPWSRSTLQPRAAKAVSLHHPASRRPCSRVWRRASRISGRVGTVLRLRRQAIDRVQVFHAPPAALGLSHGPGSNGVLKDSNRAYRSGHGGFADTWPGGQKAARESGPTSRRPTSRQKHLQRGACFFPLHDQPAAIFDFLKAANNRSRPGRRAPRALPPRLRPSASASLACNRDCPAAAGFQGPSH